MIRQIMEGRISSSGKVSRISMGFRPLSLGMQGKLQEKENKESKDCSKDPTEMV